MLFSSFEFIFLFLPVALILYFQLIKIRLSIAAKGWLVLCSLFFYSWWDVSNLLLILGSMFFNYTVGTALCTTSASRPQRKFFLTTGIITNLLALGYYKYFSFLVENVNTLFSLHIPIQNIVLPLAISFFTFQQIAYLVDSYHRKTKEYDFFNYALFVTFFPQLIAGPIVHHKEMMPQFFTRRKLIYQPHNVESGLFLFAIGLFKKCVLADTFSIWVQQGYSATTIDAITAWQSSLAYTAQLYTDFSGYMDMALGTALMFNIVLPRNFNSPYKSLDLQDFWRRWHITLGRFLRDYIYIPLGGNKKGAAKTYSNLFITFLLGGLWHGAGWTFILWGAMHGAGLCIHRFWKKCGLRLFKPVAWAITFLFVHLAWIPFRAESFEATWTMVKGLFGHYGIGAFSLTPWAFISVAFLCFFTMPNSHELDKKIPPIAKRYLTLFIGIMAIMQLANITTAQEGLSEFLYFNF